MIQQQTATLSAHSAAAAKPSVHAGFQPESLEQVPAGHLALTLQDAGGIAPLVRPFSRQLFGRTSAGRSNLCPAPQLGGWLIDLERVFRIPGTEWQVIGLGTSAIATNAYLAAFEAEVNNGTQTAIQTRNGQFGPSGLPSPVQTDSLIFPARTPGMEDAQGRLLIRRDGAVYFEARDNQEATEHARSRALYLPSFEDQERFPPMDLPLDERVPLRSGSGIVLGASRNLGGWDQIASLPILRLAWQPFRFVDAA